MKSAKGHSCSRGDRPIGGPWRVKAFTLIEMLVVMAIIAILTSIAASNYQEAIVSSKVAKFMGDGKAIETAVESYNAQYGKYPEAERYPAGSNQDEIDNNIPYPSAGYLPRSLTTPVAYLGKLPFDPFRNLSSSFDPQYYPERRTYQYTNDFQNRALYGNSSDAFYVSHVYAVLMGETSRESGQMSQAIWMISSPARDGDTDHGWNPQWSGDGNMSESLVTDTAMDPVNYDPTNGTISDGDLFMFGPSLGFPFR